MRRDLRSLTFSAGDRYVPLLTAAGDRWDVVAIGEAAFEGWRLARRLGSRAEVVPLALAIARLESDRYDVAVCHSLDQLAIVDGRVPSIFVPHADRRLYEELGLAADADPARCPALTRATWVFATTAQQASWERPGFVVPLGIDAAPYGPYTGERPAILTIGHLRQELARITNVATIEQITAGLPVVAPGIDPGSDEGPAGADIAGWRTLLRTHRLYLHGAPVFESDSDTLTMVEAMASGTPVVSASRTSVPLADGVDGFVRPDPAGARLVILQLLEDPALAANVGDAGRQLVQRQYPLDAFVAGWNAVMAAAAAERAASG